MTNDKYSALRQDQTALFCSSGAYRTSTNIDEKSGKGRVFYILSLGVSPDSETLHSLSLVMVDSNAIQLPTVPILFGRISRSQFTETLGRCTMCWQPIPSDVPISALCVSRDKKFTANASSNDLKATTFILSWTQGQATSRH